LLCILIQKFLHVVEVEHLSYPCVNLWINYVYIKSDQAIGPEPQNTLSERSTDHLKNFCQKTIENLAPVLGQNIENVF
jgi:hypothetical protein